MSTPPRETAEVVEKLRVRYKREALAACQKSKKIGFDLGFSRGKEEGAKEAAEAAIREAAAKPTPSAVDARQILNRVFQALRLEFKDADDSVLLRMKRVLKQVALAAPPATAAPPAEAAGGSGGAAERDLLGVKRWLATLHMEKLTDLFVKEDYVTMKFVSTLSWEDICDIGVPRGMRKTLLSAVEILRGAATSSEVSTSKNSSAAEPPKAKHVEAGSTPANSQQGGSSSAATNPSVNEARRVEAAARVEAVRVEAVRVEAVRVEAVRVERARVEAARIEAAGVEASRANVAQVEAARVEAARVESARMEAARGRPPPQASPPPAEDRATSDGSSDDDPMSTEPPIVPAQGGAATPAARAADSLSGPHATAALQKTYSTLSRAQRRHWIVAVFGSSKWGDGRGAHVEYEMLVADAAHTSIDTFLAALRTKLKVRGFCDSEDDDIAEEFEHFQTQLRMNAKDAGAARQAAVAAGAGRSREPFVCRRRFNDFKWLHARLSGGLKGAVAPTLPTTGKGAWTGDWAQFGVAHCCHRRRSLQCWLNYLCLSDLFSGSADMELFLSEGLHKDGKSLPNSGQHGDDVVWDGVQAAAVDQQILRPSVKGGESGKEQAGGDTSTASSLEDDGEAKKDMKAEQSSVNSATRQEWKKREAGVNRALKTGQQLIQHMAERQDVLLELGDACGDMGTFEDGEGDAGHPGAMWVMLSETSEECSVRKPEALQLLAASLGFASHQLSPIVRRTLSGAGGRGGGTEKWLRPLVGARASVETAAAGQAWSKMLVANLRIVAESEIRAARRAQKAWADLGTAVGAVRVPETAAYVPYVPSAVASTALPRAASPNTRSAIPVSRNPVSRAVASPSNAHGLGEGKGADGGKTKTVEGALSHGNMERPIIPRRRRRNGGLVGMWSSITGIFRSGSEPIGLNGPAGAASPLDTSVTPPPMLNIIDPLPVSEQRAASSGSDRAISHESRQRSPAAAKAARSGNRKGKKVGGGGRAPSTDGPHPTQSLPITEPPSGGSPKGGGGDSGAAAACQHCGANLKGVARGVGRKLGTVPKGFCNAKCFDEASARAAQAEQPAGLPSGRSVSSAEKSAEKAALLEEEFYNERRRAAEAAANQERDDELRYANTAEDMKRQKARIMRTKREKGARSKAQRRQQAVIDKEKHRQELLEGREERQQREEVEERERDIREKKEQLEREAREQLEREQAEVRKRERKAKTREKQRQQQADSVWNGCRPVASASPPSKAASPPATQSTRKSRTKDAERAPKAGKSKGSEGKERTRATSVPPRSRSADGGEGGGEGGSSGPLADGWKEVISPEGKTYFYHAVTRAVR